MSNIFAIVSVSLLSYKTIAKATLAVLCKVIDIGLAE